MISLSSTIEHHPKLLLSYKHLSCLYSLQLTYHLDLQATTFLEWLFLYLLFIASNTPWSIGWIRAVELGGKDIVLMLLSSLFKVVASSNGKAFALRPLSVNKVMKPVAEDFGVYPCIFLGIIEGTLVYIIWNIGGWQLCLIGSLCDPVAFAHAIRVTRSFMLLSLLNQLESSRVTSKSRVQL